MLISKFDLYKNEWLDLVFSDRNRLYGAYELRQHYSQSMVKALGVMIGSIIVVAFVFGVILKPSIHPKHEVDRIIPVSNLVLPPPPVVPPVKKPMPDLAKPPATPHQRIASVRLVPLVPTIDKLAEEPPKIDDMAGKAISTTTQTGSSGTATVDATPGPATTPGNGDDETIYKGIGLEREPEPVGGFAAFNKFLQKHLHFPEAAEEARVGGKVFVSFVVEKDGSLSNFTILRGPGYGTNEEALRVLKLAPAWNPGVQNDHPVRVQYNIPINFQLNDDNNW